MSKLSGGPAQPGYVVTAMNESRSRYKKVLSQLADAVDATGVEPKPVRLIAVSKTQPASAVRELYLQGQREFGENYVQELVAKAAELADLPDLRWVYIGRLQSNKMAALVRVAAEVQSVASERHARLLAKAAREHAPSLPLPCFILVNAGDEASKDGCSMDEVPRLAATITAELPELDLRGIMAIPPPIEGGPLAVVPATYKRLRELADHIGGRQLSLGMSSDLQQAIAAGSDCVRIGTALFGPRGTPQY